MSLNKEDKRAMSYRFVVGFDDVDYARVVYFSRYFEYAERAQADLLRKFGYSQRRLSEEFNVGTPVVQVENRYFAPARLDDTLVARYHIKHVTRKGFEFWFEIYHEDGATLLCRGKMTHRFIDMQSFSAIEINDELFEVFRKMELGGEATW